MAFLETTHKSIADIRAISKSGRLEMRPAFQRQMVWNTPQRSYLVDTILRSYPVPELYMQIKNDAQGNESFVVVDGQQRLLACLEFADNLFALDMSGDQKFTGDKSLEGKTFEDLTPEQRKTFFAYRFVIRILPELTKGFLEDVFLRLNRNVVHLNDQELRRAQYPGDFLALMERVAGDPYWLDSGICSANDVRRMLDVEFVSELTIQALHGPQNKKDTLDDWYAAYAVSFSKEEGQRIQDVFTKAMSEIRSVLPGIHKTRWRKKSDFYTLFGYLANRADKLPLSNDKRKKLSLALLEFGKGVTTAVSLEKKHDAPEGPEVDAFARTYGYAVAKAASDRGNRVRRDSALVKYVDNSVPGLWAPGGP